MNALLLSIHILLFADVDAGELANFKTCGTYDFTVDVLKLQLTLQSWRMVTTSHFDL